LDYGTLCASWDAADEDAWCDVGGPEACGTEATFRSGTDGEVYHYWSRAPCEKGAKPPPPLAEELVPEGPVGSVMECADPRNTYTFDHKPRCLATACGNISWTKPCFDHLARQLKVVQRHEPPPCDAQKPRLIHMYWDGPLLRTVNIAIWGIIQTQSCSRLTVWHRKAFQDSAHKRLLEAGPVAEGKLVFRQFDEVVLARGTIFEKWVNGYEAYAAKERAANAHSGEGYLPKVGFSDFVRFLVLYLFGGLYVDADVATLQDLWPLYGRQFTYRWGFRNAYNTAVLGLGAPRSSLAAKLSQAAMDDDHGYASFHPYRLLGYCEKGRFRCLDMLPSEAFDPLWLHMIGYDMSPQRYIINRRKQFFRWGVGMNAKNVKSKFFPGALTYHWHNGWHEAPKHGSAAWALEQLWVVAAQKDAEAKLDARGATEQLASPSSSKRGLLAIPAGGKSSKWISKMVAKFVASGVYDVQLLPYDGHDWSQYAWYSSPSVLRPKVAHGFKPFKWLLAKHFLTPAFTARYSHLFFWDDDMDVEQFDPAAYLALVQQQNITISQPALIPWRKCSGRKCGPCASVWCGYVQQRRACDLHYSRIVEVMVPVYDTATWGSCIFPRLAIAKEDESGTGWGIDWAVHQNCGWYARLARAQTGARALRAQLSAPPLARLLVPLPATEDSSLISGASFIATAKRCARQAA
jgi:hypothetical protein